MYFLPLLFYYASSLHSSPYKLLYFHHNNTQLRYKHKCMHLPHFVTFFPILEIPAAVSPCPLFFTLPQSRGSSEAFLSRLVLLCQTSICWTLYNLNYLQFSCSGLLSWLWWQAGRSTCMPPEISGMHGGGKRAVGCDVEWILGQELRFPTFMQLLQNCVQWIILLLWWKRLWLKYLI